MSFVIICLVLLSEATGIISIKVHLFIPKVVAEGSSPTLTCWYDVEGRPLYSVKWYRGQYEFYRFIPGDEPQVTAFPLYGFNVDLLRSNANQVTLVNVPKYISGKITCEVSIDGTFKTATDSANLTVTDFHVNKPVINISSNQLYPVEKMKILCIAQETDPPPVINFYIDESKVSRSMIVVFGNGKAKLNNTALLNYVKTKKGKQSEVKVQCDAFVAGLYHVHSSSIAITTHNTEANSSSPSKIPVLCIFVALVCLFSNYNH